MNTKLLLLSLIVAGVSSCSTAYKIHQTPDDVYYSPRPQRNDYVQVKNEEDTEDRNVYNNSSPEDREVLRPVNTRRWRRHHRYDYGYDAYGYPYGSSYNPYGYNNYPVYVDPKSGRSSTYKSTRKYNLGTYTKPSVTYTTDPKTGRIITAPSTSPNAASTRTFSKPQNSGSSVGNLIRKVFMPSNTNSETYKNNNIPVESRSSQSSSRSSGTSSSSSTGSSSSSAPVRSFRK